MTDLEQGDPARSLQVPLSEWTDAQICESNMGSKYNQRKLIATEFIDRYVSNSSNYILKQPDADSAVMRLCL